MITTTTHQLQDRTIEKYIGVVTAEVILGANLFKDLLAGIRDIIGGRAQAYENELRRARDIALDELEDEADQMGANAIVGIDFAYESMGGKSGMLMVTVSGTAVRLRAR